MDPSSSRFRQPGKHLEACHLFAERLGGYRQSGPRGHRAGERNPFAEWRSIPDVPLEIHGRARAS
jgi:hypothetical protein